MILKTNQLTKIFKKRKVVNKVDLYVSKGEIVGLLGPNGAGKTTSFKMIMGVLRPESGRIFLDEVDITELPMYLRARKGIGYLPQESSIFRKLTVEQNLLAIMETLPLGPEESKDRLNQLLSEFGLGLVRYNWAYSLSGGERRRVEIARALVASPIFLLVDEPFAGIDPLAIRDLKTIICSLKNRGIGILITDHNVRETLEICERAYVLNNGNVIAQGTPAEIINNEQARTIYLGEDFVL